MEPKAPQQEASIYLNYSMSPHKNINFIKFYSFCSTFLFLSKQKVLFRVSCKVAALISENVLKLPLQIVSLTEVLCPSSGSWLLDSYHSALGSIPGDLNTFITDE